MSLLTFGDLKNEGVAERLNLCRTDDRFRNAVNRVTRWFLLHGSWAGTEKIAQIPLDGTCFVTPGNVASLQGVYAPCSPAQVVGVGYRFLATWRPASSCGSPVAYETIDNVPTQRTIRVPGYVRAYPSTSLDVGMHMTILGYDENLKWVRTLQNGVMLDGEVITLILPYTDTQIKFAAVSGVLKDETNDRVLCYTLPSMTDPMIELSAYEYWETRPNYRRYRVGRASEVSVCSCACPSVEVLVKIDFTPVKNDDDLLLITNLPALEIGMEALMAKDAGDLARADALFFGTVRNKRLGAIPLLQQELRTSTNDRAVGHVSVQGVPGMRRVMSGFI